MRRREDRVTLGASRVASLLTSRDERRQVGAIDLHRSTTRDASSVNQAGLKKHELQHDCGT